MAFNLYLQDKKILVTGASSGIGRQTAIDLAEQGAKVVLVARNEIELQNVFLQMTGYGHQICPFDLQNIKGVAELVKSAVIYDGLKFDGFVHCAGDPAVFPLKVVDYAKFEAVFKVNFYSYLEIVKNLSKKQYSNESMSIVYISSEATRSPWAGQSLYVSSKSASVGLSVALPLELKKRNIRINNISPCTVETKMLQDTEHFRAINSGNAGIKGIHPREIANVVLFLLSDRARFINGEDITVG